MESVLEKFQAMKEERMRFINDTQSKQNILLSNKLLNTCNMNKERRINIEDISKQIFAIQNFINSKDNYRKHFRYYTSEFFQYFNDKFKELYDSYDFDNQINDIKILLDVTEELIDEFRYMNQFSSILNKIKENFCLLDALLQVNYSIENEEINKVKLYSNKIKADLYHDEGNEQFSKKKNKMMKSIMRYAKIFIIKENNIISKSINYNDNYYSCNKDNNSKECNYDMNIYFNKKENKLTIKRCLNYITKHMIMKYIITYNKQSTNTNTVVIDNNNDNKKDYNQFIHYSIYGIGKSSSAFMDLFSHLMKSKVTCDSFIKCSIYSTIDYILNKNLSNLSSKSIIHHNFKAEYLEQYLQLDRYQ